MNGEQDEPSLLKVKGAPGAVAVITQHSPSFLARTMPARIQSGNIRANLMTYKREQFLWVFCVL